jgi:hypothetical protein
MRLCCDEKRESAAEVNKARTMKMRIADLVLTNMVESKLVVFSRSTSLSHLSFATSSI